MLTNVGRLIPAGQRAGLIQQNHLPALLRGTIARRCCTNKMVQDKALFSLKDLGKNAAKTVELFISVPVVFGVGGTIAGVIAATGFIGFSYSTEAATHICKTGDWRLKDFKFKGLD